MTTRPKPLLGMTASLILGLTFVASTTPSAAAEADGPVRVIVFGAHPDDCEIKAGGTAVLWAQRGDQVKFVSTTNGDIGHAAEAGGALAKRRTAEVAEAAKVLGVTSQVLDNHDGELMPTLENRKQFVRLIREWKAEVVMGPRVYDYHPDHRYTGVLMQDAAFMVTVAYFCPDVPQLSRNPVFLYLSDGFQKPYPFEPDIVVSIDEAMQTKSDALWLLESQIESLWATGDFERVVPVPTEPTAREARKRALHERFARRAEDIANRYRDQLVELYGEERGRQVRYAEAFELCEYGRRPSPAELRRLFPIRAER